MDLRAGERVTEQEARTLTGLLRSALHDTGAFTLINREDMEAIAKNHEIELIFCDDDACLLQVGSLLGAQKLVAGEIGLVLGEFIVNARLIDIAGNALANERVASQRSAPTAEALQEAMGELASALAGKPRAPRVSSDADEGGKYDGLIYSTEDDRVLIDRGKRHGVRRGAVYDVFAPPGANSSGSPRESGGDARPKRMGRIEVVETRRADSAARWQDARQAPSEAPGCRIRKFRVPSWLSLEVQSEYHLSKDRVIIDFAQPYYDGDVLAGVVTHKTRVEISGVLFGASAMLTPRGRFGLGVRGSMIAADVVRDGYSVGPFVGGSSPQIHTPAQSMYRLGAALRMRLLATRKFDFDLEAELDRVFWDLDYLDREPTRPPWGLTDLRAAMRFYIFDRWGISCCGGSCNSIGGDWEVASVSSGIGLFRRF